MRNYLLLFAACIGVIFANNRFLFARTSISDNNAYPEFCRKAAKNPKIFNNFKQDPIYSEILEHATYNQGKVYLNIVRKQTPEFLYLLNLFRQNDRIGNPKLFAYEDAGLFSPTTLRYMKVASDLKKLFGSLDDLRIIEIGGGYGGQCTIIHQIFKPKSYTIVDLPGPLALTAKYLQKQQIHTVVLQQPNQVKPNETYDLIISNYAFSECNRAVQEEYITKILGKSKKGYLTNNWTNESPKLNSYTKSQLIAKLQSMRKNCRVLPEVPLTHANNYILIWEDKPMMIKK